jgi:hypothetical protein
LAGLLQQRWDSFTTRGFIHGLFPLLCIRHPPYLVCIIIHTCDFFLHESVNLLLQY